MNALVFAVSILLDSNSFEDFEESVELIEALEKKI